MVHDGGECSALFVKDFSQCLVDISLIDNLIGIGTGECVVEEVVDVIGVSLLLVTGVIGDVVLSRESGCYGVDVSGGCLVYGGGVGVL